MLALFSVILATGPTGAAMHTSAPNAATPQMSMDMQQFCKKLNPANQQVFSDQFSDDQRAQAMGLVADNPQMTPDAAVEQVANGGISADQ